MKSTSSRTCAASPALDRTRDGCTRLSPISPKPAKQVWSETLPASVCDVAPDLTDWSLEKQEQREQCQKAFLLVRLDCLHLEYCSWRLLVAWWQRKKLLQLLLSPCGTCGMSCWKHEAVARSRQRDMPCSCSSQKDQNGSEMLGEVRSQKGSSQPRSAEATGPREEDVPGPRHAACEACGPGRHTDQGPRLQAQEKVICEDPSSSL